MHRRIGALAACSALALTLTACQSNANSSGTSGGSSGGSSGGGNASTAAVGGDTGTSVPAPVKGGCGVGPHSIYTAKDPITGQNQIVGKLEWACTGPVAMNLKVWLIYVNASTGDEAAEHPDEGQPIYVDNVTQVPPQFVFAPCVPGRSDGLWKMKIIGQVEGGSVPIRLNTQDKVNPPFNTPKWQTPTTIKC